MSDKYFYAEAYVQPVFLLFWMNLKSLILQNIPKQILNY